MRKVVTINSKSSQNTMEKNQTKSINNLSVKMSEQLALHLNRKMNQDKKIEQNN